MACSPVAVGPQAPLDSLTRAPGLDGGIVFDAGGEEEADVARRVRAKGLQLRIVGVGRLVAVG